MKGHCYVKINLSIKGFAFPYLPPDKVTELIQGKGLQRWNLSFWYLVISISNCNILRNNALKHTRLNRYGAFNKNRYAKKPLKYHTSITSHGWSTSLLVGGTATLMLHSLLSKTDLSACNCIRFSKLVTWRKRICSK